MNKQALIAQHRFEAQRAYYVWEKQDSGRTLTAANRKTYADAKQKADAIKDQLVQMGYNPNALDEIPSIGA